MERQQNALIQKDIAAQPNPIEESNRIGEVTVFEKEAPLRWVNKVFALEASQAETVNLALKRAQDLAGNIKKSPSSLLALVCLDFLSGADWQGGNLESKLRFLAKIEQSIGLRLVVVDDADEVVYGLGALEAAANHMRELASEVADGSGA